MICMDTPLSIGVENRSALCLLIKVHGGTGDESGSETVMVAVSMNDTPK